MLPTLNTINKLLIVQSTITAVHSGTIICQHRYCLVIYSFASILYNQICTCQFKVLYSSEHSINSPLAAPMWHYLHQSHLSNAPWREGSCWLPGLLGRLGEGAAGRRIWPRSLRSATPSPGCCLCLLVSGIRGSEVSDLQPPYVRTSVLVC